MAEQDVEIVEYLEEPVRDPVVGWLQFSIAFVIVLALTGLAYLLVGGVITPSAPRTALEAQLVAVRQAVQAQPESGEAWADYVTALVAVDNHSEAHRQLEAGRQILSGQQLLLLNISGVDLLLSEDKYEEAFELAEDNVSLQAAERERAIKDEVAKGVFIDEKLLGPEIATDTYLTHAKAAAGLEKWETVVESLSKALEYSPRAADLFFLRGDAYERLGRSEEAVADYQAALRFDPEFEAARVALEKVGE